MSNLSELLPTGGGQNAVDFVATGTLASGQTVALKTDGTVEAVSGVAEGVGTAAVFESADTGYINAIYDSNSNKVVIAYSDVANSYYGTAIVGTVSGTSISFGTAVLFAGSSLAYYVGATFDSNSNKVVIAYQNAATYGAAVVGTVSGTSISFGTAVVFESAATYFPSATFDSTNNKVVIAYRDQDNGKYGTAIVGTVSGTSISFGTAVVFRSLGNVQLWERSTVFDSTNSKVVIAYNTSGNASQGEAVVGTVSGTSISFGSMTVFEGSYSIGHVSLAFDSTNGKVIFAYTDVGSGNTRYGTAIVGTVSGTSISFGTKVAFNSILTSGPSISYDLSAKKSVISYYNSGTGYGTNIVGTVSGTSISFGTPVVFNTGATEYISNIYDSTSSKVVTAYRDDGNSNYGTAVVFTVGSSNNTDFIGITSEAISSGATGAINTYGGINTVQTGLTIASDYYVQSDGTLSTASASPAIKVGQAVSATTINMKDLT